MAIKRRDFVAGVAVGLTATGLSAGRVLADSIDGTFEATPDASGISSPDTRYYPPSLTGLRGSHAGSFEVAHSIAMGGQSFTATEDAPDGLYDLIVVGGGVSGLAAAWYWLRSHPDARILILDNHDDFGGHAKRNEFEVAGKRLIGYGGSQSIEAPSHYSPVARQLLTDLGIDVSKFYHYYDRDFAAHHGLGSHWYFDRAHFQRDTLAANPLGAGWLGVPPAEDMQAAVASMPLDAEAKAALATLLGSNRDWLSGRSVDEKVDYLRSKSYEAYLRDDCGMPEAVILLLRNRAHGLWAVGYDALSALAAAKSAEPGTTSLGLEDFLWGDEAEEPYIFHFPDGNAGIARLLVRQLIPNAALGQTMEDMVTSELLYDQLDKVDNRVRVRLNATATDVRHSDDDTVTVQYHRDGANTRVRGRQVIMACYNHIIPHICPELPADQAEAMAWPEKAPLVYTNVALNNWRAFKQAKLYHFQAVRDFWAYGSLDFPVSMPGYDFAAGPDDPIVLHLVHVPTAPGKPAREQYREGRRQLLALSFEDYERQLRRQLTGMLGPYGFDFDRDVAAITVNRWPHGYAYEYIDLWDPADWGPDRGPHILARKPFGRIAIANSDSSAYAYINGAIDAAWRAVNDLHSSGQS